MPSHRFLFQHPDGREEILEHDHHGAGYRPGDNFTHQDILWRVVSAEPDAEGNTVVALVRDDWYQSGRIGQRPVVRSRNSIEDVAEGNVDDPEADGFGPLPPDGTHRRPPTTSEKKGGRPVGGPLSAADYRINEGTSAIGGLVRRLMGRMPKQEDPSS
jgi:hypothetical protein